MTFSQEQGCILIGLDAPDKAFARFAYDEQIIVFMRNLPGSRWNPSKGYWTFAYQPNSIKKLNTAFKPRLRFDRSLHIARLVQELRTKKYSLQTLKQYVRFNTEFLLYCKKEASEVIETDMKKYLSFLAENRDLSASSLHCAISALKFFYFTVLKRQFAYELKRPRKDRKVPLVLNAEEILCLFSNIPNVKHRLLLMIIYSSRLSVSEAVSLRISDIDMNRNRIRIRSAKEQNDRYTVLSSVAAATLKQYLDHDRPETWVFPGQNPSCHLSIRTAESVFKNALRKAGISKEASIHSLRLAEFRDVVLEAQH